MLNKKIISITLCATLIGVALNAKEHDNYQDDGNYHEKKVKHDKQKEIPAGLQKKLENGERLPIGWEKKLEKGQIANEQMLHSGRILNTNLYPNIRNTEVYQVEDKIFRISRDTKEILDILK